MATKLAVYIGRFQTFHNGHAQVLERAYDKYDAVLVLIGSTGKARDIKNPFTGNEREQVIHQWLSDLRALKSHKPFFTRQLRDFMYSDSAWIEQVQSKVAEILQEFDSDTEVVLVGSERDQSTWYLRSFPQWKTDFVDRIGEDLSATTLRSAMFDEEAYPTLRTIMQNVPLETAKFVKRFVNTPEFKVLQDEFYFIEKYKQSWAAAPYAPTFLTVDACVIQSGHVLVIRRRAAPGKGLWALPGGFVNQNERLQDASIRELIEETKIKLTPNILRGAVRGKETFDHPDRSLRGRTVTTTFLYRLDDTKELPAVKGTDDADKAFWLPISEARKHSNKWFEDHLDMLEAMLGMIKD